MGLAIGSGPSSCMRRPGYGWQLLPKDTQAWRGWGRIIPCPCRLTETVIKVMTRSTPMMTRSSIILLGGSVNARQFAVLGGDVSNEPRTICGNSPSLTIDAIVGANGARCVWLIRRVTRGEVCCGRVLGWMDAYKARKNADALVILTEMGKRVSPHCDLTRMAKRMATPVWRNLRRNIYSPKLREARRVYGLCFHRAARSLRR